MERPAHSIPAARTTEARGTPLTNLFLLIWLVGTVFYDKGFAYLRVGPLFVTEIAMGLLLWSNRNRFRPSDFILAGAIVFYVGLGAVRHGSLMMAYKDIAWMPYLYFLRFFPRNFPARYVKIAVAFCFAKMIAIPTWPAGFEPVLVFQKYGDGITLMFCFLYLMAKKDGNIGIFRYVIFLLGSWVLGFKTLMVLMMMVPLVMRSRLKWERLMAPVPLLCFVSLFLFAVLTDLTQTGLVVAVDALNAVGQLVGAGTNFETGTAVWRAEIWTHALNRLFWDGEILFGQFPGYNFMDNDYLGVNLHLRGGQGLGVVRTAHCIVVQITMKAGIVGLILFGYYFLQNLRTKDRLIVFFALSVFLLGMTADLLEVPSRGPLFYCMLALLVRTRSEHEARGMEEGALVPSEGETGRAPGVVAIAPGRERWTRVAQGSGTPGVCRTDL